MEEQFKVPIEYWVALGLQGDGAYGNNIEFVTQCILLEADYGARKEYCREFIFDNWRNLFDASRMEDKTSKIFGSGDISPTSITYPYEENLLWNFFDQDGKYFWKYACASTSFFDAILLFMAIGSGIMVLQKRENEEGYLIFQSYMAVMGLMIFLLFWEAQNKQLFNHIPWMTLAAVVGIECATERLRQKITSFFS